MPIDHLLLIVNSEFILKSNKNNFDTFLLHQKAFYGFFVELNAEFRDWEFEILIGKAI